MPFASADGAQLFYQSSGQGEPLVLIPGLGTTHAFFNGITPALAAEYQVIGLDLRGVGQSGKPRQAYSMEGWADDVARVLDHLGLARAHVLGSSLGGCVAQAFAHRHPQRTRSLVLAATFSEIDRLLELNYRVRIDLIEQHGMSQLLADLATTSLFGRSFLETEAGRAAADGVLGTIRQNEPEIYLAHLRAVLAFGGCGEGPDAPPSFTARLADIACPALVMCGDEDVLTVPRFSRLLAEKLPRAQLLIQQHCGHVNLLEQPGPSAQAILQFLRRVE